MSTDPAPEGGSSQPADRSVSRTAMLAAAVGLVTIVALVLLVTQREPVTLPEGSPEATVQAWMQSVVDGSPDTSLLVDQSCTPASDLLFGQDQLRIVVHDSSVDGDTAAVELEVTEQYGLFDDGYIHIEPYRLERTADGWRITAFDWPWDPCFTRAEDMN